MNALTRPAVREPPPAAAGAPDHGAIRDLFIATQEDYRRWSEGYNMHFGYWAPGMSLFAREPMLERMNHEAIDSLRLDAAAPARVVDLGCGAGATSRAVARRLPRATVVGVTLVHEQIRLAARLNRSARLAQRIAFVHSDFTATWMAGARLDGAIALESFCYAAGPDKAPALREAARLLRPGARLAVVDGFLARGTPDGWLGWVYRHWCACWSLPGLAELAPFTAALERAGFEDVQVRDLFWNIAPCAAQIPWVAASHTVRELWRGRGRLSAWRWRHIAASVLSIVIGLAHHRFRYCLVTATRSEAPPVA